MTIFTAERNAREFIWYIIGIVVLEMIRKKTSKKYCTECFRILGAYVAT